MNPLIFIDAVKTARTWVVRNTVLCLAEWCCPTARMLATTNNHALHLNKEEAFSHAAEERSPQLIAFRDGETQSENGVGPTSQTWIMIPLPSERAKPDSVVLTLFSPLQSSLRSRDTALPEPARC